jgi:probable rRNA maturation factor
MSNKHSSQSINIIIERLVAVKVTDEWLFHIANIFAQQASLPSNNISASVIFVSAPTIKKINRRYRHKDCVTDVLSFPDDNFFVDPSQEKELGDIFICVSRAKQQAREFGHSLEAELARLLIHGLAHLLGYEHEGVTKKEAKSMFSFESRVLRSLNMKLAIRHVS